MKPFLDSSFLLGTATAERLYFDHANGMPVIDYHSHLNPAQIADNHRFENITQAWLQGDHYKWRAMRANGIDEQFITGQAADREKFNKWAQTVPYTIGNPLFHWTHLELNRYFGIRENLSGLSANQIYAETCAQLKQPGYAVQGLLKKMKVEVVCTTDDPIDTLEHHIRSAGSDFSVRVLPTWRPDKALIFNDINIWNTYIDTLSERSGISIQTYDDLLEALQKRHDFFHQVGCRLSDHGLEVVPRFDLTPAETRQTFATLRKEKSLPNDLSLCDRLSGQLLLELARMDAASGWVQQFHIGALRSNNTRALSTLGPDTGFDSIGDQPVAHALSRFLDQLDSEGNLAKTILYNLNPSHNEVFASMTGNFQDGSLPGKIQWGSAWWFLDQKDGMEKQIKTLSNFGLLSRFVGMLTDSRSFLSYPRHEYFRRILCNFIGDSVEKGEWPNDPEWLGQLVEGICYYNARSYFGF